MQYRKKPVVVNAFKWTYDVVPEWWRNLTGVMIDVTTESAFIPTPGGTMEAKKGDYIIQGVNGEVYPCKPDIFAKTYEPASGTQQGQDEMWEDVRDIIRGAASKESYEWHILQLRSKFTLIKKSYKTYEPVANDRINIYNALIKLLQIKTLLLDQTISPETFRDRVGKILNPNR